MLRFLKYTTLLFLCFLAIPFALIYSNHTQYNPYSNTKLSEIIKYGLLESAQAASPETSKTIRLISTQLVNDFPAIQSYSACQPSRIYLLETMGQMLALSAQLQNENLFLATLQATEELFKSRENYYYWALSGNPPMPKNSTALIDELRITNSLTQAESLSRTGIWKTDQRIFHQKNIAASEAILQFNLNKSNFSDFYDGKSSLSANQLSLFFIDTDALKNLLTLDPAHAQSVNNAISLLKNAPVSGTTGFYPSNFNYVKNQYVFPSRFNMVEQLISADNSLKAGKANPRFIRFLASTLRKEGKIYNSYYLSGQAFDTNESTAVYALAYVFLSRANHPKDAAKCFSLMQNFRTAAGGYGHDECYYAFDQFCALDALLTKEGVLNE